MTYKNINCIIFNVEYGGEFVIRLLVLWLLDNESMSGYDIKQMLQTMDAKRWGGVLIGSIYYALKKLEKNGYICVTDMEQAQYRPRVTYSITQKGKKYLRTLIYDSLTEFSLSYPSSLYAGISLCDKLTSGEIYTALESQLKRLDIEYESVMKGWKEKCEAMNNDVAPMVKLVFDNMFAMIRQQQDFIKKVLECLET